MSATPSGHVGMDIYNFQAHLEDEANFAEGGTLHCLDAVYSTSVCMKLPIYMMLLIFTKESLEPSIRRQVVLDTEVEEWMKGSSRTFNSDVSPLEPTPKPRGFSLRLIALEDPKYIERLRWSEGPLAIRKEIYSAIATHFEISPMFLTAALRQEAVFLKVGRASIASAGSDSYEAAPSMA